MQVACAHELVPDVQELVLRKRPKKGNVGMPCKLCGNGKSRRRSVCAACTGKRKKVVEEAARLKLLDAVSEFRIPEYNSWNTKFFGTKYRPDFWWLLDGRVLVLEIDERGHIGYDKDSEARRERELRSSCPLPVTILRFTELTDDAVLVLEAHLRAPQ